MADLRGLCRLAALLVLGAPVAAESCAQSEGISPSGPVGGSSGDASIGGAAGGGGTSTSGGAPSGGAAGALTGGVGASGGSAGSTSGGGTAGASGGTTGGSGGTTGGSGGTTGGSGGTTGGTGGTGGTTGGTGGTTGGTGGTGGATGGTGGVGGCDIVSYPFTGCPGGWISSGTNNDWQCGVPSVGPPNGDHTGGGQCFGTKLNGTSANCADSTLTSPVINLSQYSGLALKLRFWHWYSFRECNAGGLCGIVCALDKSTYSGGVVEVYDGSKWVKVAPPSGYSSSPIDCYYMDAEGGTTCSPCTLDGQNGFAGTSSGGWEFVEMDISSYASASFQFRFHFASYGADPICHQNKPGWYIDDVSIAKLSCP